MVLLEKTASLRIGVKDPMSAHAKALEAARDKALPTAPGQPEVEAPPQYQEFVPGSSGDGRVDDGDLDSISDVSSLAISVVPPTERASHPSMSVRSRSSPLARPDSSYSYVSPSEPIIHPAMSVRSRSSPSATPSLPSPSASRLGLAYSPSSLRHDLGGSMSEFGASESSIHLESFQASPDPSLVPSLNIDAGASHVTLTQSRSASLASLAPSIALAEKASVWKPGSVKKASKQARVDIFESLRNLMAAPGPDPAKVLNELAMHATAHKWSLQTILQEEEAALDSKSAVYWAVAKLGPGAGPDAYACARAILSAAAPLGAAAMSEVRAGALLAGDQNAWLAVRPWLVEAAWQDAILFGEAGQVDQMDVVGSPNEPDTFLVAFSIPLFRKRMKLKKRVAVDFFAKGRLFNFTFIEVPASGLPKRKGQVKDKDRKKREYEVGSWVVSISLLEPSPETPVTARLVIDAVLPGGRAPIDLRIGLAKEWRLGAKEEAKKKITDEAIASTRDSLAGRALELDDSPYVDVEGSLQGRLYVKLDGDEDAIIR